ncbi:Histidine kinase [anaerobic digester metagenome]
MKRKHVLLIHLFYWFYIINQALFPMYIGKVEKSFLENHQYLFEVILSLLLNVVTFYTIYFAFPYLMKYKNRLAAACSGLIIIALLSGFRTPLEFISWKFFSSMPQEELVFEWAYFWNNLRLVIIAGIYAVLIWFMIRSFEAQKLRDELIKQQQAGELALLRSQINPHFLFNTLNNIYSLVYKKSDEAPPAIMKLSSIMRYMLYDATGDRVPLDKEIEYLRSFIELQKLRIRHPESVSFTIEGNTEGRTIAPMMLISFVENAFKHGSKTHQPFLVIRLAVKNDRIAYEVVNYLRKTSLTRDNSESGIGLSLIKKRLALLYPGKHHLQITEEADTFRIKLEIMD